MYTDGIRMNWKNRWTDHDAGVWQFHMMTANQRCMLRNLYNGEGVRSRKSLKPYREFLLAWSDERSEIKPKKTQNTCTSKGHIDRAAPLRYIQNILS